MVSFKYKITNLSKLARIRADFSDVDLPHMLHNLSITGVWHRCTSQFDWLFEIFLPGHASGLNLDNLKVIRTKVCLSVDIHKLRNTTRGHFLGNAHP